MKGDQRTLMTLEQVKMAIREKLLVRCELLRHPGHVFVGVIKEDPDDLIWFKGRNGNKQCIVTSVKREDLSLLDKR